MQESIGTEDNEDQSEEDPGDNSKNFHSSTMTSSDANSNSEVVKRGLGPRRITIFPETVGLDRLTLRYWPEG
jgi:hypothetical protein